ncbi:hypothetical protein ACFYWN_42080 [Streptomyces sp. NPDC002917]|uniref:hypothetical protein n=1 Tax=Streptomyces sp. NPDC002917 TaxID=3364671 RepID=UPI0036AAC07D
MQREHSGSGDHSSAADAGLSTEDLARPRDDRDADRGTPSATADDAHPSTGNAAGNAADAEDTAKDAAPAEQAAAGTPHASAPDQGQENEPLLGPEEAEAFKSKWQAVQTAFVDDPQDAVRTADALVAEVMQTLARSFASRKEGLESQWGRGEEVLTEDLRIALQRYRSFFNRLLSA